MKNAGQRHIEEIEKTLNLPGSMFASRPTLFLAGEGPEARKSAGKQWICCGGVETGALPAGEKREPPSTEERPESVLVANSSGEVEPALSPESNRKAWEERQQTVSLWRRSRAGALPGKIEETPGRAPRKCVGRGRVEADALSRGKEAWKGRQQKFVES